jgi:molybdopterin-synthase adenylyltransferase
MTLTEERIARFARQLLVPAFGERAQQRLAEARVRVVGVDAISAPALVYLAQAGVGRLWLEDGEHVAPADVTGWIFDAAASGAPRVDAAREALSALSRFTSIERYPVGGVPTAALIAAPSLAVALAPAEAARRAGVPHVVLETDADGGAVISVPARAPCYACARSISAAGRPAQPGVAALAALAAAELVQMIALPGSIPGRRLDLIRGVATTRATVRLAGCSCGVDPRHGAQEPGVASEPKPSSD